MNTKRINIMSYVVMPDGTVEFISEDNTTQEIANAIAEYTHGVDGDDS